MKREIETKFYTFSQNNSGGYFVTDEKYGIGEYVIIEAISAVAAWNKLKDIGDNVSGFDSYCSCCGERWSSYIDEDDAKEVPSIWDTPVEEHVSSWMREKAFVHYFDNIIKKVEFGR